MNLFVPITPLRAMTFDVLGMPSASELQRMHDMLRFVKIRGGRILFGSDGGMVIEIEDPEDYAFRARATGRLQITFTAGEAYMVNETPTAFSGSALVVDLPEVAGDYVVYLRHTYGVGAAAGTWGALTACLAADIPSELTDGRVVARNFVLCAVTVTGSGASAVMGTITQRWRQGDATGYAPYLAPEDGA